MGIHTVTPGIQTEAQSKEAKREKKKKRKQKEEEEKMETGGEEELAGKHKKGKKRKIEKGNVEEEENQIEPTGKTKSKKRSKDRAEENAAEFAASVEADCAAAQAALEARREAKKMKKAKREKEAEEESEAAQKKKKKSKFSLSLKVGEDNLPSHQGVDAPPPPDAVNKKNPGKQPKIIIATETGDKGEAEGKKKRKRKRKAKEGAVHETKGMNKALRYLTTWHQDRDNWKFEKCRQIWLLHNIYDSERISEKNFPALLEYIGSVKGAMRTSVKEAAKVKVERADKWQELYDAEVPETEIKTELGGHEKPTPTEADRARKIWESLRAQEDD